jgi:hypothetical protein
MKITKTHFALLSIILLFGFYCRSQSQNKLNKQQARLKGDSIFYEKYDTIINSYQPYYKQKYNYDNKGNITSAIFLQYYKTNNNWINNSK